MAHLVLIMNYMSLLFTCLWGKQHC